jgi:DNA-directed RNA polymerase alpha subunit
MARSRRTFRPRDITAAIKAMEAAGLPVSQVDISPEGRITVHTGSAPEEEFDPYARPSDEELERLRESFADAVAGGREVRQWRDLGLPKLTAKVLAKKGIHTLPELAALTDGEMMKWHNFGPRSLDAIHRLLKTRA